MIHEPTPEDLAAAREQGDLVEVLLNTTGRTRKKPKATEPQPAKPNPVDYGPLHRPGAWPFGVGSPGSNTCHPDCGCAIKPKPPEEP